MLQTSRPGSLAGSLFPVPFRRRGRQGAVRKGFAAIVAAGTLLLGSGGRTTAWGQDAEESPPVIEPDGRYDYRGKDGEADAVDALFPQSPERVRQLRAIERAVEDRDWDRAAEALLFILREAEGEVVRLSDGTSATVVDEAGRMLDQFPAAERRALSLRLSGAARVALEEALATADAGALRSVAVRFPATDAAREASIRLALLHLDRGEAGLAARLFDSLLNDPTAATELLADPRRRAAVVAAFSRGGEAKRANALWSELAVADRAGLGLPGETDDPNAVPSALSFVSRGAGPVGPEVSGDPLLVPRWSIPIVLDPQKRQGFRDAVDRLQRADTALLPVWDPLTVSTPDRDLVLTRTTGDVLAADAATGQVVWRSRPTGFAVDGSSARRVIYTQRGRQNPAESNETVSSVYRGAAFGRLTTDGSRVFLLEADEREGRNSQRSNFNRYAATAGRPVRLVAYRVDTGLLDWEVGGTLRDEPFDLPLAGWRPLAAPTVDGGDLFLVAERVAADGLRRIAVFCLDPATGRERWSRTVAYAEASVEADPARAEWGAWCAVSDGVIVVPTTVGWIAGVDRLTREVLWVERISEPEDEKTNRFRGFGGVSANAAERESLSEYWRPGPPMIQGKRVLFGPPGEDELYGLDLLTGERLWSPRKRRNWKAVVALLPGSLFADSDGDGESRAAGDEGAVVVVGPDSLAAYSLKKGADHLWTRSLPKNLGPPSGMPLVVGDRILVPMSSGALVTVDAATGKQRKVAWRTDASAPARGLGALGVSDGRLVSVGPGGLVGFEDRDRLAAELAAAAAAAGSKDALLVLREAELLRTAGLTTEVLEKLETVMDDDVGRDAAPASLSAADAERFRALLRSTLRDAILGKPDGAAAPSPERQDALLDRLEAQADTPARQIAVALLRADRLRARGESDAAVRALDGLIGDRLGPAADPDANPLVPAAEGTGPPPPAAEAEAPEPDAEVRLSRAVSGDLRTIWEAGAAEGASDADRSGRAAVDELAAEWLARDAIDGRLPAASAAAELLPFHPVVADALVSWSEAMLAAPAIEGGAAFAEAELTLIRIADSREDSAGRRAAEALKSLAESAEESGGVPRKSVMVAEAVPADVATRPAAALTVPAAIRSFFRSHTLAPSTDGSRLDLLDVSNPDAHPTVVARFPLMGSMLNAATMRHLQMRQRNYRSDYYARTVQPAIGSAGGLIFAVTREAVAAVHPQSAAMLWSRQVDGAQPSSPDYPWMAVPSRNNQRPPMARPISQLTRSNSYRPRRGVVGANAEIVLVVDDRELSALDARTGELIWVKRRLESQNVSVLATSTTVLVHFSTNGTGPGVALAARDGSPLSNSDEALEVGSRAQASAGAGVVHLSEKGGDYVIRSWDPASDRELWKHTLDGEALIVFLSGGGSSLAAIVSPDEEGKDREASMIELHTGEHTVLGGMKVGGSPTIQAVADADRVMFLSRPSRSSNRRYAIQRLQTTTIGGNLEVFSRNGGRLWRTHASGSEFLHQDFEHASFVTLLTADEDAKRGELSDVELVTLDKDTGRELLRTLIPVLTDLQFSAVSPEGDELSLWNANWIANQLPAQEYWRLRTVVGDGAPATGPGAAGERVDRSGDDADADAVEEPRRNLDPNGNPAVDEEADAVIEEADQMEDAVEGEVREALKENNALLRVFQQLTPAQRKQIEEKVRELRERQGEPQEGDRPR